MLQSFTCQQIPSWCVCLHVCVDPQTTVLTIAAEPTVNPQTQEFCDKLGIPNPFVPSG